MRAELSQGRRAGAWTVGFVQAGALYLLLIDTTSLPELLVGAGAAALSATGWMLAGAAPASPDRAGVQDRAKRFGRSLRATAALTLRVPGGILAVATAALHQCVVRRERYGAWTALSPATDLPGPDAGPATAQWAGSLAPNTCVAGSDRSGRLLVHRLGPAR